MRAKMVFPGKEWPTCFPQEAGLLPAPLLRLRCWLETTAKDLPYRLLVLRHGRLAIEWERGLSRDARRGMASAAKSIYSSMLGIAIAEGMLPSADARVVDYYPEMMDVPEGYGPKEGRYAFPKDREITFRQLISNTSGYMKPGEAPGEVFHYQTFGMNILMHALGRIYGVYDSSAPGETPTIGPLVDRMIKNPIGGTWHYQYMNFSHPPQARTGIFGFYTNPMVTARDMARLGLLWLNNGRWEDQQVIPAAWHREALSVATPILENAPPTEWRYGHGFWTNAHGLIWPNLPRDAYAASGAGQQLVWICPSLALVIVQSPGIYGQGADHPYCQHVLESICNALEE